MRKDVYCLPFAILLSACVSGPTKHSEGTESLTAQQLAALAPVANPADVASPEALVRAIHDSASGPAGTWDPHRLQSLVLPYTRGAYPDMDDKGVKQISIETIDHFIRRIAQFRKTSSWYETTLVVKVKQYDRIAVAYYSGQAGTELNKKPDERGISVCEMIYDGKRWWVVSDIWNDIGDADWPAELDPAKQRQ